MSELLILPDWLIESAEQAPRRNWGARICDDRVEEIGPNETLRTRYPQAACIRAEGQVLSPGFVNAHTHLYGVLAHGIPLAKAPAGFWPFLHDFWWPMVEDRIDLPMLRAAVDWQCAAMLRSGVTSFYDCLEAPFLLPGCLEVEAEIVQSHGLRAILSFEATQRVSRENGLAGLQENHDFTAGRQAEGGLVQGMQCFHTTFTCSAEFIQRAFALAAETGGLVHAHCSEGLFEPEQCLQRYGLRTFQYYDRLGVLSSNMLASQCVQVDANEIDLLAQRGVRVAHMPLSNCEVGGGIAPVPQMISAGVCLGLGSDSYIDDFFAIMRAAFLIHKAAQRDPGCMPAWQVYSMATEGGARALGLEKVGRIEPGWKADLQLIAADFPTPAAEWNLYDQLILYANPSQVRLVMVAGRILLQTGEVPVAYDPAARAHLWEQAARLWKKAL